MNRPDVQRIALVFADGSLGVMRFVTAERGAEGNIHWTREATPENVDAEILKMSVSLDPHLTPVLSWRFIEKDDIPVDRTFRDAWRDNGKSIVHDMPKCRELHKDRIRRFRAPQLQQLDVEYQQADEDGDTARKKDIARRKKKLRDATNDPRIESAKTPEELKAVNPLEE